MNILNNKKACYAASQPRLGSHCPTAGFGLRHMSFFVGEHMALTKQSYKIMLRSPSWQEKRVEILNRAGGVCEHCGRQTQFLEVHHEKYSGTHPSDTDNEWLKAICRECHDLESWTERLRKYSEHKAQLEDMGVVIDADISEELIRRYEV